MIDKFVLVGTSTVQTLLMVLFSTVFSLILGSPIGVLLCITNKNGIMPKPVLNQVLSRIVNVLRSFPFIILIKGTIGVKPKPIPKHVPIKDDHFATKATSTIFKL